jgi:Xylanase inhibitor N-terminal
MSMTNYCIFIFSSLFSQGPHPLYKPVKGKIVPPRDSLCQELQGNQNNCATCRQCDYEIEYADRSSSVGVLARDEMHLVTSDAEREKLSFVFGYAEITTMVEHDTIYLEITLVHIQGATILLVCLALGGIAKSWNRIAILTN